MNIATHINQISDPATRKAVYEVFRQLKDDLEVNKSAFDNHYHDGTGSSNTPLDQSDADVSFEQSLK